MAHQNAYAVTWSELPSDAPMELITRKRILGEHLMISRVHLSKGFSLPTHQHANEQFAVVLSGRIRFDLGPANEPGSESVTLEPGQVLVIPSNAPHSAHAIEDCLILDVFSPPSEMTGVDRS